MGIDIGYCDPETGDLEDGERVTSVEGFFSIAEVLTRLLDILDEYKVPRNLDFPDAAAFLAAYEEYISQNQDEYEDRFTRYCDFVCQSYKMIHDEFGTQPIIGSLIQPQVEEFRPEIRIFMGRCLLNPDPVGPEEARLMLYALVYLAMVIARFVAHFKDDDPAACKVLEGVKDMLALISRYCEGCIENQKSLMVSF